MPPRTSRGTTRKASAPKIVSRPASIVFADAPDISTMPGKEPPMPPESFPMPMTEPEQAPPSAMLNLRRTVMSHETVISVLCILFVVFMLAAVLVGYIHTVQIGGITADASTARESQLNVQRNLLSLQTRVEQIDQRVTNLENAAVSSTLLTTSSTVSGMVVTSTLPLASLPVAHPAASALSPSGALVRGSFSPDGTQYAGYDVKTVGKKGVAVETVSTASVKLVVPFNPATQSSGLGLPQESSMSVRWLDNQTLQYDVILKNPDGTKTQKVETVKVNP